MTALALLYALAMAVLVVYGVNQFVMAALRARMGEAVRPEEATPEPVAPDDDRAAWPAVTVQLPLYNERYVAARLLDACAALDYPRDRLSIQVLDDSTDDTAALVAERVARHRARGLAVEHVRRAERTGFKAGALAHGLVTAPGELVAVFDADFVPPRDFLRRTVPHFRDPGLGLVQARWGHLNAADSLLTETQAAFLDVHFAIEQTVRSRCGWLMSFNGTAGVWRRAAIEAAGGWHADTLTEDLDLSLRAQLAGWRLRFLPHLEAPAELPDRLDAWHRQQFRWTKGTAETARKLLGRVLRAPLRPVVRAQAALHLVSGLVYAAVVLAALTHAPVLVGHHLGHAVPGWLMAGLSLGLVAFGGMVLAHAVAQRALHPASWRRRMLRFPLWLVVSMGLAPGNVRAAFEGVTGRASPFVRTPKGGYAAAGSVRLGTWALAGYSALGLVALVAVGAWEALPFQGIFVLGFGAGATGAVERVPSRLEAAIAAQPVAAS